MTSTLVSRYDSHLKHYYYVDSSNGIISFDSPNEVKRSSSTTSSSSSTSSKNSFFKKIPKKFNICQRLKSISNHNNDAAIASVDSSSKLSNPNVVSEGANIVRSAEPLQNYDTEYILDYQQEDVQEDDSADSNSLFSVESYVSSIDDQIINNNAYHFYNSNTDSSASASPSTTMSTASYSSISTANMNSYYYNYCKSEISKSIHSLTIMNPDEFLTMRGNLDDYNHDEIQSLHDVELYSIRQENETKNDMEGIDEKYNRLSDSFKLLSEQLFREFNTFEDDDDQ